MTYVVKNYALYNDEDTRRKFIALLAKNNIPEPDAFYHWLYESEYTSTNLITHVIFHDNTLIGFGSILLFDLDNFLLGSLVNLYIDDKHRTLGPAIMLQRSLLDQLRNKNAGDFLLAKPNNKSEVVVKRLGFKNIGEMKRYVLLLNPMYYLTKNILLLKLSEFLIKPFLWCFFSGMNLFNSLKSTVYDYKSLEFVDNVDDILASDSAFRHWRYAESNNISFKLCRFLPATHGPSYIIFHLDGYTLVIDDIRNIANSQIVYALGLFISRVIIKYHLRNLSISMLSKADLLDVLSELGFIQRKDGTEQSIFVMNVHDSEPVDCSKLLKYRLFPTNLDF